MIIWPAKPAAAVEKYAFDFTDALNGATISGSPTVTGDGVTVNSDQVATVDGRTLVLLLLSGGTEGSVAKVSCSLATSGGETLAELGVLPIGGEAVSLAEAKAAQRIEGDEEDALLSGFLRAAIGMVERRTGKNLTPKVETQRVDGFPCVRWNGAVPLFKGPVSEILELAYDDSDGVEQVLASFRLVEGANARLLPAYNEAWPVTAYGPGSVRISYVAGYDPAELPPELTQAAILLFGHFNANREAVVAANAAQAAELPLGVEALIAPYCAVGIA